MSSTIARLPPDLVTLLRSNCQITSFAQAIEGESQRRLFINSSDFSILCIITQHYYQLELELLRHAGQPSNSYSSVGG